MATNVLAMEKAAELERILEPLGSKLTDDDRLRIRSVLMRFLDSLGWDAGLREIRRIGDAAFEELGDAVGTNSLARIRARSEHLRRYAGALRAASSKAEDDVAAVRLDKLKGIVDSTTHAFDAVTSARAALKDGTSTDAVARIEGALAVLAQLLDQVKTAAA